MPPYEEMRAQAIEKVQKAFPRVLPTHPKQKIKRITQGGGIAPKYERPAVEAVFSGKLWTELTSQALRPIIRDWDYLEMLRVEVWDYYFPAFLIALLELPDDDTKKFVSLLVSTRPNPKRTTEQKEAVVAVLNVLAQRKRASMQQNRFVYPHQKELVERIDKAIDEWLASYLEG